MDIKLYNTLSRKKEIFKAIKDKQLGMYTCGPTVYGPGHLGHARSYVNFDLLKRMFSYNHYQVNHVLNITDVHDDMIKKANELGISIKELANRYTPLFKEDLSDLNIIPADHYPTVTENIPEIIEMVKTLVNKDYAYVEKDGSVYFDVSKFKDYGQLSGIKLDQTKTGTRVETDKYEKENVADFVLWKGHKPREPFWPSPWGKGRPGWHIECSVMAKKYLGETIDLHGGAMDLKFPHHENEIAQSQAANGKKFVNFWFHAGLLEIEGQKMSKSLGNYIEIHQIKEKEFDPLALRYLFLTAHYRSQMNFTWKGLKAAQRALQRLRELTRELKGASQEAKHRAPSLDVHQLDYQKKFLSLINDDLNIPGALALTWDMSKHKKLSGDAKHKLLLDFDRVFGLNIEEIKEIKIPEKIKKLVKAREYHRKKRDWQKSDEFRKKIEKLGYTVEDTPQGSKVKKL